MIYETGAAGEKYMVTKHSAKNFERLYPFFCAVDRTPEKHFRFTSRGFEPLVVENLDYSFQGHPVYSITHYYNQNGDLMRDPDMTVMVDRLHGHVIPLSFRQDNAPFTRYGVFEQSVFVGGKCNEKALRSLDDFLNTWSKNILAQGFDYQQVARDLKPVTLEEFSEKYVDDPSD